MGLIDSAPSKADEPAEPKTPSEMSPDAIMASLHLPKNMVKPFKAVVDGGLKVLFSEQTHKLMLDELNKPGPMPQKLGEGIAGLMALLFQESQRSIAPQLLIPGGMVLMAHAADYLNQTGQPVSPQDFGAAVQVMIETILKAFKVDPQKVMAAGDRAPTPNAAAPAEPAAPDAAMPGAQ